MSSITPISTGALCGRKTRAGGTCRQRAMLGQTVCFIHGGKSPQALRKAEERMRELVHPAISALERLINGNDFNATRYVLDYAGFRAAVQVNSESEVTIRIVREEQPLSLDTPYHSSGTNGRAHD
jgi:hypothetical protein